MKLSQLIHGLDILEKIHFSDRKISGLSVHSKAVGPHFLFVAIPGTMVDGHQFINDAVQRGAAAIVAERRENLPDDIPILVVANARAALSRLAATWNGHPSRDLYIVGVTGTNGKTTITCLLQHILHTSGKTAGRLGTIGYHYPGMHQKLDHTTPEPTEIHRILKEMKDQGVTHVAMEVSSHALDMNRADDIHFKQALFTNLTPEHLDYHKSMELYFESKKRLFTQLLPQGGGMGRAIVNADDAYGRKLIEEIKDGPVWTYSTHAQSKWDFFVQDWHSSLDGLRATVATPQGEIKLHSPLIGAFNLANILAATAGAMEAGVPLSAIKNALEEFSNVPGRLERIPNKKNIHVFVDYAHTPDALKNVLIALRELNPPRITTVFGCGGDRDRSKRPIMGREAARFSHAVIVTSDNPRTEDPQAIIEQILPGIQEGGMTLGGNCLVEPDRRRAIVAALGQAKSGEVVLIAGKGHEDYQILGTQRIHFDDREVAREVLE
jgi:UDP-N-acetylmuramyl-tripeptide synthetase